jgi:hypothetical protein
MNFEPVTQLFYVCCCSVSASRRVAELQTVTSQSCVITITILDIIHRPVFYLKLNSTEMLRKSWQRISE